jgi:hypothetical protein
MPYCLAPVLGAANPVPERVRRDIRFEASISNMKQIFIRFLAIKTGFICFFRIKATQQILLAKRFPV